MPLQSRVTPAGDLIADPARGLFMGNRGGRIHNASRQLTAHRWASRQWICCVLAFKFRHRKVWGESYTELFFLDEVTALAAGHRPCFECRRADANAFADAWPQSTGHRPSAPEMDAVLHAQRLDGRSKRTHARGIEDLPDGAVIQHHDAPHAIRGDVLLRWSPAAYSERIRRPVNVTVDVLTPPAIVSVLSAGYLPRWHESAV